MAGSWAARLLMFGVGATFGGLYLGLKDLLPYLDARKSGVIVRRGHNAIKVQRDTEPDRFAQLLHNRRKGLVQGFALSAAGIAAVVVSIPLFMTS